jgi:DNA-binding MarR family transcriptional regulator
MCNNCLVHESSAEAVTEAVLTASRVLVAVAVRSLRDLSDEVTLAQYRVLVILASRGPQLVGALAEQLEVMPSTATRLCDRLVRKGLVQRDHSPSSRREVEVRLTTGGRGLVDRVTRHRRKAIDEIVQAIPPANRRALVDALQQFAEAAGEVPEQSWSLGWGP